MHYIIKSPSKNHGAKWSIVGSCRRRGTTVTLRFAWKPVPDFLPVVYDIRMVNVVIVGFVFFTR